jgi:hypothetical protein
MSHHLPLLPPFSNYRKGSKSTDPILTPDFHLHKRVYSPSKLALPKSTKLQILPPPSLGLNPNSLQTKDYSRISPLKSERLRYKSPQIVSSLKTSPNKDSRFLDLSFQQKTLITPKFKSGKSLKTIIEKPEQILTRKIQPASELANIQLKHKDKHFKEKRVNENPYLKKISFLIDCYKETLQRKRVLWVEKNRREIRAESFRNSESPISDLEMIPISFTPLPDIASLTPNSVI